MFKLKDRFTIIIVTHNMQQAARVSRPDRLLLDREDRRPGPADRVRRHPEDLQQPGREEDRGLHHRPLRLSRGSGASLLRGTTRPAPPVTPARSGPCRLRAAPTAAGAACVTWRWPRPAPPRQVPGTRPPAASVTSVGGSMVDLAGLRRASASAGRIHRCGRPRRRRRGSAAPPAAGPRRSTCRSGAARTPGVIHRLHGSSRSDRSVSPRSASSSAKRSRRRTSAARAASQSSPLTSPTTGRRSGPASSTPASSKTSRAAAQTTAWAACRGQPEPRPPTRRRRAGPVAGRVRSRRVDPAAGEGVHRRRRPSRRRRRMTYTSKSVVGRAQQQRRWPRPAAAPAAPPDSAGTGGRARPAPGVRGSSHRSSRPCGEPSAPDRAARAILGGWA